MQIVHSTVIKLNYVRSLESSFRNAVTKYLFTKNHFVIYIIHICGFCKLWENQENWYRTVYGLTYNKLHKIIEINMMLSQWLYRNLPIFPKSISYLLVCVWSKKKILSLFNWVHVSSFQQHLFSALTVPNKDNSRRVESMHCFR